MSRLACLLLFVAPPLSVAEDVVRFRGNDGNASFEAKNIPAEWSSEKNVVWRADLPSAGSSSPIVVGDRIYLTCYSGYAQSKADPGDQEDLERHVICLSRETGKPIWQKDFEPSLPESAYSGGNNSHHGYATSTCTSDGEHLYVFFGRSGVYCLKLSDGEQVWHASVGDGTRGWGSGSSPFLFENLLIVNASVESGKVVALDKSSGDEVWSFRVKGLWSTPIVAKNEKGESELVVSAPQRISGHDPKSGEELWNCKGIPDRGYTCPSPVAHDGVAYMVGGRQNTCIAVKLGGKGDVTESHVLWTRNKGSNVSSCVVHEGHVYWVHERRGVFYGLDAKTGAVVVEERIDPAPKRPVYSSVAVADGKLFAFSQFDGMYVFAAKPKYEQLAHNTFEGDPSRINAVPVFHDDQLLLRTDEALYCIGTK